MQELGDYVLLSEAVQISGLNPDSIKRLLRLGEIEGRKTITHGRYRWVVSLRSLRRYMDPGVTYQSSRPGPKPYLKPRDDPPDGN